ncbi:MAG: D-alanine--D-alanine ligase [Rhodospirillaceae bacterium]|jgi:D-alanine-D-alanine ligase|nr:D-alanine--D-alanine ligase [Rhodospirillaceae bacterium]MBT4702847.1 D-alanine--D-alanine ligase [Rhodospirillaceae bacterium]MBT5036620.1 D-alanine--D-alanine ligase [Rhodospirillaceae bacterium]MBT6221308.1 D-alanine--D-alanine ligase [Rhodospirillaceae bacterium]MBT6361187.1 D-alanine--D-alanine ligase [Rhodospirillaceae bacterium]
MTHHVAVLMGGWSAEREVSLVSGAAVSQSLSESGNRVTSIDVQRDMGALMTRLYPRPDALFNALHGRFGEDGCVQGLMDILEIPYTHSGLLASALAMDKPMAKRLFAEVGIPVAEHKVVNREEALSGDVMAPPYVIKPLNEGSSVGVVIIKDVQDLDAITGDNWPYGTQVMVEKYIPGKELCVAVMGDRALAVTEIETDRDFYDYDAKYVDGGSKHTIPARLDENITERILELAQLAHQTLGCRGVSRADFRLDGDSPYLLEINTQPGMTPTSLVPEQASHAGISFNELVTWMVDNAEYDR